MIRTTLVSALFRQFDSFFGAIDTGTYKVRNEIETKRNEINENETKRNEINKNETKRNEINETKTK
jgi:hypothetical protein